ncbi:hypothetical protein INR49_026996 [Caranx melampygus]|nr:hypothetical protein INR49_026996 [Caranx melampygus]
MKDLSLSRLSRGCGRLVSSNRNTGRHDGRLDVCFTPQDYYIWKSRESLLRLSSSGHPLMEEESTLPKTYSTRKGPLLLYSQDLVTIETSCGSEAGNRKRRRFVRRYAQHVEQRLSTLKELTAAILNFTNNRFPLTRLSPPLHFPPVPDGRRRPTPLSIHPTQAEPGPELPLHLNPQWLPAQKVTEHLENQAEDEEEPSSRNRVRLDLFLQIPCDPRSPTPQMKPQPWVHYVATTPEEPEEPQIHLDVSPRPSESSRYTEINNISTGSELQHPDMNCVHDVMDDRDSRSRSTSGYRHEATVRQCLAEQQPEKNATSGLVLPPLDIRHSIRHGLCREDTNVEHSVEHRGVKLPPIAASCTAAALHTRQDPLTPAATERDKFQSEGRVNRLRQQPLALPLLFPEREEPPPPPPAAVLGGVAGRRGPGRQSSLAFLQNRLLDLQDPGDVSSAADRGVVRGVLPLELRDLQNSESVGSLILGPDGEIIQLSLFDSLQDASQGDDDDDGLRQHALQVLSPEGETLPWVIVLQPEPTHTGGGAGLNSDDLMETVTQNKTKTSTEAGIETWRKRTTKHNMKLPPLREVVRREERKGDNSQGEEEEEEEEEDEDLTMTAKMNHLSESQPPGEQHVRPTEASKEEAVDRSRKNMRRKTDSEEAAVTTGKREMKTMKTTESDRQKRTSKEGGQQRQKTGGHSQPIRRQKQEERISRDTVETEDRPDLQSVKKKRRDGERGGEKTTEEREEARRKEVSAGRGRGKKRRRRGLKHKEIVEIEQESEEESQLKSNNSPTSVTQKHNNNHTNTSSETDCHSASDEHSSVRSVGSLSSSHTSSHVNQSSSRRSDPSHCEGAGPASAMGLASSRGRLSSCSTVMVTEEQLMLNPVKPESSTPSKRQQQQEEAAALHLAQQAERRRQVVERKRREREEQERKQQEREQIEERMKNELEEERRRRGEELRSYKLI